MEVVEASIVLLPRFTTLVGVSSAGHYYDFTTLPLDVSRFSGAQFQFWRGAGAGTLGVFLEESLDADTWSLGPFSPAEIVVPAQSAVFFSYNFLLRWFRLRVRLTGAAWPIISCWAEGLLRGGGSGAWPSGGAGGGDVASGLAAGGVLPGESGGKGGGRELPEMMRLPGGKRGAERGAASPETRKFVPSTRRGSGASPGGAPQSMGTDDPRYQAMQELLQRMQEGDTSPEGFARMVARMTKKG
jgi:hypothetical protein